MFNYKNFVDKIINKMLLIKIIESTIKYITNRYITNYAIEKLIETFIFSIKNLVQLEIRAKLLGSANQKTVLQGFNLIDIFHYYYSELIRPILKIIFIFYNDQNFYRKNYKELMASYSEKKNIMLILWLIKSPWKPLAYIMVQRIQKMLNCCIYGK